jgi:hypothetical protein
MEKYFHIYLMAMPFLVLCWVVRLSIRCATDHFDGSRVFRKNMAKIGLYRDLINGQWTEKKTNLADFFRNFLLALLTSWLGVVFELFSIFLIVFSFLKGAFTREPPRIAELIFPLKITTTLASESVWARTFACAVINGACKASPETIDHELTEVEARIKNFRRKDAIEYLRQLNIPELENVVGNVSE